MTTVNLHYSADVHYRAGRSYHTGTTTAEYAGYNTGTTTADHAGFNYLQELQQQAMLDWDTEQEPQQQTVNTPATAQEPWQKEFGTIQEHWQKAGLGYHKITHYTRVAAAGVELAPLPCFIVQSVQHSAYYEEEYVKELENHRD